MDIALGYQNRRQFPSKPKFNQCSTPNDPFDRVLVKTRGSLTSERHNHPSIPVQLDNPLFLCSQIDKSRFHRGYTAYKQ